MKLPMSHLLMTAGLLLGATTAHAALPDEATLYKNPQCGCCDGYARHLMRMGVDVTIIDDQDVNAVKKAAGVPYGMGSCHTVTMGDYVIEGHVPLAAVEALFDQRPDTAGIGLSGMPSGTPGMPGPQTAPSEVYQFQDQQHAPFVIPHDDRSSHPRIAEVNPSTPTAQLPGRTAADTFSQLGAAHRTEGELPRPEGASVCVGTRFLRHFDPTVATPCAEPSSPKPPSSVPPCSGRFSWRTVPHSRPGREPWRACHSWP